MTTSVFFDSERRLVDLASRDVGVDGALTIKQLYDNVNTVIDTGVTLVQQKNNSASTTNPTATFTSTPTNGNAMIALLCRGADNVASTGPSGWVQLTAAGTAASRRVEVWWKRAGASEPTTHTWTNATAALWDLVLIEFGGIAAIIDPIVVSAAAAGASATTTTFNSTGILASVCVTAASAGVTGYTNTGTNCQTVTNLPFTTTTRFDAMLIDGWTNRESGQTNTISWTTARSFTRAQVGWAAGNNDNDSTGLEYFVGNATQTTKQIAAQFGLRFDTSAIPDANTVTSATLSLKSGSSTGNYPADCAVNVYSLATASITADNSNTRAVWKKPSELAALTRVATRAAGSAWAVATSYAWTSDGTFPGEINKTGNTTLVVATADQQAGTYRATVEYVAVDNLNGVHSLTVVHNYQAAVTAAATTTLTPAVTRTVAFLRSAAASVTATPTVSRALALLRTVAATISALPVVSYTVTYSPVVAGLPKLLSFKVRNKIALTTQSKIALKVRSLLSIPEQ